MATTIQGTTVFVLVSYHDDLDEPDNSSYYIHGVYQSKETAEAARDIAEDEMREALSGDLMLSIYEHQVQP